MWIPMVPMDWTTDPEAVCNMIWPLEVVANIVINGKLPFWMMIRHYFLSNFGSQANLIIKNGGWTSRFLWWFVIFCSEKFTLEDSQRWHVRIRFSQRGGKRWFFVPGCSLAHWSGGGKGGEKSSPTGTKTVTPYLDLFVQGDALRILPCENHHCSQPLGRKIFGSLFPSIQCTQSLGTFVSRLGRFFVSMASPPLLRLCLLPATTHVF